MKKLIKSREFTLLIIILLFFIIVSFISPSFFQITNITNIINNSIPNIILACGMTVVILTGGIEIAVAVEMVVASFIVGTIAHMDGSNIAFCFIAAIAIGGLLGVINGVLIAFLEVPPIIATLGTMNIFRGALLYITKGKWIVNLPGWITNITRGRLFFVPASIYIVLFVVIFTTWMLKYTKFGRSVYAIGGNINSAQYAGIKVKWVLFGVYIYAGLLCGVAGFVNAARLGNIQPSGSINLEMIIIASVVMGGTSILGGTGTAIGSLLGVIMMTLVDNILILLYIPTYWQRLVLGAILIITITINVLQKMYSERNKSPIDVDEILAEKAGAET